MSTLYITRTHSTADGNTEPNLKSKFCNDMAMLSIINLFNTHVPAVQYTAVLKPYVPSHPCDFVLLYLKCVGSQYGTWSMLR